ncbi:MAG: DNA mismatch repair protein MutS [Comamonas sp. SCN 65-56]|uniref:Smr/MutS family protein n=1 Tax=Comamonas sp. SCN 65-56 TaxID=1660095 RepID=UPI00086F74FE|nr:Smr/MutS family protein [Comamonas sp. SCN 65-56]ODS93360.1 MAG: DNA mismatch repair protein MutS [Comamonas sp. SCN 65-56]
MREPAARSFAELALLRRRLRALQEQELARQQAEREARERAWAEQHLFESTVGAVVPLRNEARHWSTPPQPAPHPVQRARDEQQVLAESLSDEFDISTLLDVDDQLSFRRPGIGLDVTRKLRAGHWSIQRQLDLHGLRQGEAREALAQFIRLARRTGLRCVRIIHGKGLGSPGKTPVLKGRVQAWLVQKREVLAFVQAKPADGGAGALVVLLQPGGR